MKFDYKQGLTKMMESQFRKVDDAVLDMQTGSIGYVKNDQIVSLKTVPSTEEGQEDEYEIVVNPIMALSVPFPAFAQNTPLDSVKIGDLILDGNGKIYGWVVKKNKKSLSVKKPDGSTSSNWSPPKVEMMGMGASGAMVVRSFMGEGMNGNNNMMQMMMMSQMFGDDDDSFESILPFIMMQNNGGNSQGMDMNSMMMPMMMAKMMGKKNENLF